MIVWDQLLFSPGIHASLFYTSPMTWSRKGLWPDISRPGWHPQIPQIAQRGVAATKQKESIQMLQIM
jgi:hypothetical protein